MPTPPSHHNARREPLLFARPALRRPLPPRAPAERARLDTGFEQAPEGYRPLRGATTPMMRPQAVEDQENWGATTASVVFHTTLLALILWEGAHQPHGNLQSQPGPQVEMVFDAPPSKSGMRGPHSQDQGGAASPPKATEQPQTDDQKTDAQSEAAPTPAAPTPEAPSSPPVPEGPTAELPKPTEEQRQVSQATPQSGHGRQSTTHAHHGARRRAAQASNNPFANLMDLSFDQAPSPSRRRHGRAGGSNGPIDMSLGPLVSNGQINAPYETRNSVRGVSEDYGEEIDRWIRAHMFYPEDAARNGEEGPSSVHVVLDRSGHVRSVRLTGQSGSYALDAATTGMFQGANLPRVPPDMKGDHFDIDLTIDYILIRR